MFGMQKLEVTRKGPSCQRQGEVHIYNSTGWQLNVEDVNENLFTVKCRLSKVRSQTLHLRVTNSVKFHVVCTER